MVLGGTFKRRARRRRKTVDTKPLRVAGDPEVVLTKHSASSSSTWRWRCTTCRSAPGKPSAGVLVAQPPDRAALDGDRGKSDIPADVKTRSTR
jgi:hypothetical protein